MKERKGIFKGFSEEVCWLPLTATVMQASNTAMIMSCNNDYQYCRILGICHDMLVSLYVDAGKMPINIFNRFFLVFVYVFETVYGNINGKVTQGYVSPIDFFNNIKKHWNTDITKELQKICKYEE